MCWYRKASLYYFTDIKLKVRFENSQMLFPKRVVIKATGKVKWFLEDFKTFKEFYFYLLAVAQSNNEKTF